MKLYIYINDNKTTKAFEQCTKALVVLLSFYCIKVSQLHFIYTYIVYIYVCVHVYVQGGPMAWQQLTLKHFRFIRHIDIIYTMYI